MFKPWFIMTDTGLQNTFALNKALHPLTSMSQSLIPNSGDPHPTSVVEYATNKQDHTALAFL